MPNTTVISALLQQAQDAAQSAQATVDRGPDNNLDSIHAFLNNDVQFGFDKLNDAIASLSDAISAVLSDAPPSPPGSL
jgi:hypothetical protein